MIKTILQNTKFRIIAITLIITVVASVAISSSIAFFTDTKESETVFTAGNVYIEISEAATVLSPGGNLVEDSSADRIYGSEINDDTQPVINHYGVVFPGQTIHKDPTIKNIGSGSAWIAAKVIIEDGAGDIHNLFGLDNNDEINIGEFLKGGLLDQELILGEWNGISNVYYNENYALIQNAIRADGVYEFYFIIANPLEEDGSIEIFDTLYFSHEFNNAEMLEMREMKITVQAFAVQTFGFSDCLGAMEGAFRDHFEIR